MVSVVASSGMTDFAAMIAFLATATLADLGPIND
jgi:hypothetical protein